ncbi:hypothetical protein F1C16_20555 (plasmid) [Hymenobacter sp. NBH84]|uniref:hypothetical protein n=1 Tax=Hymenobacter sp. NBH84 TaxID=2596915 RepID=UPI001628C9C2|nr:hypothetical protein [Hymenobacter sp. NBH84]QNE42018.1 hypothetical protein F1C16_20555 [Hymenobacter sp. NBH84]
MKTLILVGCLMVGAGTWLPALAQRHIKGVGAIGVHYGRTEKGTYAEISYNRFVSNALSLRLGATRERGTLGLKGEYSAYGLTALAAPQLFRLGETAYLHLLVGVVGRYERTGENGTNGQDGGTDPQRATVGPQAGAELDVFFGNRFSLVGTATKSALFGGALIDRWPGFYGVGLRYHLY